MGKEGHSLANPSILLQRIAPDTAGAVSQGFQIGQQIRQAPLLNRLNELKLAQAEQQLRAPEIAAQQAAEQQKQRVVASALGQALAIDDPVQRAAFLRTRGSELGDERFIFESEKVLSLPFDEQTAFLEDDLRSQGFESFIPKKYGDADLQKQVNVLRKEADAQLKDFRAVEQAHGRIKAIGNNATPASDLALIFNYMKMLDPGSVVRESEFKTAEDAKAWLVKQEDSGVVVPAPISNAIRRATEGTILEPAQRVDFLSQASDLFGAARQSADTSINNILQQGEQDGIGGVRILGGKRFNDYQKRQETLLTAQSGGIPKGLPSGTTNNGDGTFTLPDGTVVEPE